jgi:hypothetical protein
MQLLSIAAIDDKVFKYVSTQFSKSLNCSKECADWLASTH